MIGCEDNMIDELVSIAQYNELFEADLAKGLLEENGIYCTLKNEYIRSMINAFSPDMVKLELQVLQKDEEAARKILAEIVNTNEFYEILLEIGAIKEGHFLLTSGRHTNIYVEKIKAFQYPDIVQTICTAMAKKILNLSFDCIIGPAYGGIVLAYELARQTGKQFVFSQRKDDVMTIRSGFDLSEIKKAIIVEDIVTTGGSVKEVVNCVEQLSIEVVSVLAIVDRSGGTIEFGYPLISLITLQIPSWEADDCELCKQGIELIKPGRSDKK